MSVPHKHSILWLLSGVMLLIFAAACGFVLSGVASVVAAKAGVLEDNIAVLAVLTLLGGFAVGLVVGLRDLAMVARRIEPYLPRRWVLGSILVMFVAGPFWNICVVQIQEPISGSDLVRTVFDYVLYGLMLTLTLPLALGVPLLLARVRRQARLDAPLERS